MRLGELPEFKFFKVVGAHKYWQVIETDESGIIARRVYCGDTERFDPETDVIMLLPRFEEESDEDSDLKEGDYFREKENHRGDIWCLVDGLDTHRDCSAAWPVSGDSPYWFDHNTEVVRMIPNWTEEE